MTTILRDIGNVIDISCAVDIMEIDPDANGYRLDLLRCSDLIAVFDAICFSHAKSIAYDLGACADLRDENFS